MALMVDDNEVEITEQGFLCRQQDWNEKVAEALARQNDLVLNDAHWEIIHFIRRYYQQYQHLPNARMFVRAVRHELGDEKGNSRYLQRLFPEGPLKYACLCAGLPKPPTCL
jgi:tRNA 2-thiouridine synthesizing protein E